MDYELEDFDRKSVDGYVGALLILCWQTDSTAVKADLFEGFKEPGLSGNYHDLSIMARRKITSCSS